MLLKVPGIDSTVSIILTILGGVGFGFFSILAGGCPLKLHVKSTKGDGASIIYLVGFYVGLVYFHVVVIEYVAALIGV